MLLSSHKYHCTTAQTNLLIFAFFCCCFSSSFQRFWLNGGNSLTTLQHNRENLTCVFWSKSWNWSSWRYVRFHVHTCSALSLSLLIFYIYLILGSCWAPELQIHKCILIWLSHWVFVGKLGSTWRWSQRRHWKLVYGGEAGPVGVRPVTQHVSFYF